MIKRKELAQNLLLSFFAILFSLLLLEVFFRVFMPQSDIIGTYDEFVGWTHRPNIGLRSVTSEFDNTYRTNSQGFIAERDYAIPKPPNTFRVLVLGDSFAEALQVPFNESFSQVLEKKLKASTTKQVEVINAAVSGYGTDNEYLMLNYYGLKYNPDLVIMMFLPRNDFRNNYFDKGENQIVFSLSETGQLSIGEKHLVPDNQIKKFIGRNSHLVRFVYFKLLPRLSGESAPADYDVFMSNYTTEFAQAFSLTEALVLATDKLSRDNGAPFLLVTLTDLAQLDQQARQKLLAAHPASTKFDFGKPNRLLDDFCESNNLTCLDLLGPFEQSSASLHYPIDGHWTAAGHALAAQLAYQKILAEGYLNSRS